MSVVHVAYTGTWLTNLLTGEQVQLFKQARELKHATTGQITNYAGRNVIESTTQKTGQIPMLFLRVDPAVADTLQSWETLPMLLTDGQGWHRTGTFFDVDITNPARGDDRLRVAVTWQDSDYPLGV